MTALATPQGRPRAKARQLTLGSVAGEGEGEGFHPAVAEWFRRRFPDGPTPPQAEGWVHIAAGRDTLIAAPTGSGKTLAGFLVGIDRLYRAHEAGEPVDRPHPGRLRVAAQGAGRRHRREPRAAARARSPRSRPSSGSPRPTSGSRSAPATRPRSQRTAMLRQPPSFVVTTPESLYLLVTSKGGRELLRTIETVIVDEIHAVARDKRGAHLALTLERLEALCDDRPARIGLSATQRPIETVARLLVGDRPLPVDRRRRPPARPRPRARAARRRARGGHVGRADGRRARPDRRARRASTAPRSCSSTPGGSPSGSRTSSGERLGDDVVAAHHGSLSKERRHRVERRLRAGELKALVATASLELGIDIGPVELVCQIGSPRSIATFLQRVGRSNHSRAGTPKGRLYPLTRDELVECAALLAAVRAGRLDAIEPAAPAARHRRPADRRRDVGAGVAHRRPVRAGAAGPRPTPS